MTPGVPTTFGNRVVGISYRSRPGSYAVIHDQEGRIVVMVTHQGCFLPGGGTEPGESLEATLRREVIEECGCELLAVCPLCFGVEYVFAEGEGYFAKECSFYLAQRGHPIAIPVEADHTMTWMPLLDAAVQLSHGSQRWAVLNADRLLKNGDWFRSSSVSG